MTGTELKAIRRKLGLSARAMGRALGYGGADTSADMAIWRFERGDRPIPPAIARLALMYAKFGLPLL